MTRLTVLILSALFMSASAASADTRLRRAVSPFSPSTYCTSMPQGFTSPSARLASRLHAFATNRHEYCGLAVLLTDVLLGLPGAVAESDQKVDAIAVEDYALYDQIVTSKFLSSATQLVVIERMTRLRLSPDQEGPTTIVALQEQEYFDGELPTDLVRQFISVNRQPSRLEGRFHFGVGYRFATGDTLEEPEVSLARPVTVARARPVQAPSVLDRLAFSRVARSLRNDHALMYVEALRPNGTGAGFLVWCRRQGRSWTVFDTEVAWTIQAQAEPEEGPLLAP